MALKQDIKDKVSEIIDNDFDIIDSTIVPQITDSRLTFGNTALKFEATVVFIDMRGSTKILNNHNKMTVAKLHMSFFHTIVKIANSLDGNVRSFNGDSALIFFQGTTKKRLSDAVKCAMQIKYMLANSDGIKSLLEKYTVLNFGIGIDNGKILCTKVGIGGEHNRDLFWIGNPVNKSTVLGDNAKSTYHISISKHVYNNLEDRVKFSSSKNMWNELDFEYNEDDEVYYYTSYHWSLS